jgi:hypothetical protein
MKVIRAAKREKQKPGPKPVLEGERLNFLPGRNIKKEMDDLISDFDKVAGEKLTYAYILREGAVYEVRYLKTLLQKAQKGQLGAKKRESILPKAKAMAA